MVNLRRNQPLKAVAYMVAGFVVAAVGVVITRYLHGSRTLQEIVAFVCVAAAYVAFILRHGKKSDDGSAAIATFIGVGAAAVAALSAIGSIQAAPGRGCITSSGSIKATVSSDRTIIFSHATPNSKALGLLLSGCNLSFSGYCIGAVYPDALQPQVTDSRWLILSDHQGLIPSAQTVGDVPAGAYEHCPGDVSKPSSVDFSSAVVDEQSGRLALAATAPRAALIGFAARVPGGRWRRIGWDTNSTDDLPLRMALPPGLHAGTVIDATACIAFQRPSAASATLLLRSGTVRGPLKLSAAAQPVADAAAVAACNASTIPTQ